jgi:quercetin dioxygenase-like cupin family protein
MSVSEIADATKSSPLLVSRTARFSELEPMEAQKNHPLPQEVADLIWSRRLLPVITLGEGNTPFGSKAPIAGAGGITMTIAACPPGTGPSLHRHFRTWETFTVLKGQFEFRAGPEGEQVCLLGPFDVISFEPGSHRAFRNVSSEEGLVQVVISGGVHDMNDIDFPAATAREIRAHGPEYLDYFKKTGLNFEE